MPVGRPRKYQDNRVQIQIRLTRALRQRLQREARKRGVSGNLIAERAIEEYLDKSTVEQLVASNGG